MCQVPGAGRCVVETQEMRMRVRDQLGQTDLPHPRQGQPTAQAWSRRGAALGPRLVHKGVTPVMQAQWPGSRARTLPSRVGDGQCALASYILVKYKSGNPERRISQQCLFRFQRYRPFRKKKKIVDPCSTAMI